MNEDQDRTRMGNGPNNIAVLRHIALNAMQKEGLKGSIRGKFKRAGWDDNFLLKLMEMFLNAIALRPKPISQQERIVAWPHATCPCVNSSKLNGNAARPAYHLTVPPCRNRADRDSVGDAASCLPRAHLPMKVGVPVRAELIYPVFAGNKLVLPAHTMVVGTVVALNADHGTRVRARFNADFTPFHKPVVRFESLALPDGTAVRIVTGPVTDGAPIYRLVAPPPVKGGFFHQALDKGRTAVKEQLTVVTAPEKADRFVQFLYHQLPYHTERIQQDTAWTAETTEPVVLPASYAAPAEGLPAAPPSTALADGPPTWIVQAYLTTPVSSEFSKTGDVISATVAEPILNPDGSIAIPQGSVLTGEVNHARSARRFSHAGELSFSFKRLQLPGQEAQSVRTSLKGADSPSAAQLAMDSEGQVKPKAQDKVLVPLLLIALAGRPLDRDHGEHMLGKDAVASNSLGLAGLIIDIVAQRPNIAAGFGYYGAAVSTYTRIVAKGKPVAFVKDTRVVVQTTGTRAGAIHATAAE